MTLSSRDRRALILLTVGLIAAAILRLAFSDRSGAAVTTSSDSTALAQQRLARLRQIAATVPAREAVMKQAAADLAEREKGMIPGDTAAQAQAALLEAARSVGKSNQLDVRGGEFGAPKAFGAYGLVYATVTFECHIEQLVNFLADLSHSPELISLQEERITSGNQKDKTMAVRMILAGVIPKKLIPEKKGLGAS